MTKLLRRFLGRYVPYILACVVLIFVQVFAELKLPDLMSNIVNTGIVNSDVSYITAVGVSMLGWALLSMAAVICVSWCAAHASMGFGRDVRSAVFRRVEDFSLFEFDTVGTSSLITRATNDVTQVERLLQIMLSMAVMAPLMFIGASVMAWMKSPQLSRIIFLTIPVLLVLIIVMMRYGIPLLRSLQGRIDHLNLVTRENLSGMRVIRAYNKEGVAEERFAEANRNLADTNVKVARLMGALMPCIIFTINMAIVIIMWIGGNDIYAGTFLVGDLMAIIQYATMMLISVMMLSMMLTMMPRALAAAERIGAVLDIEPAIHDVEDSVSPKDTQHGHIEVADVTFIFPGATEPTLRDVSVEFEPGQTTAIIGATGSGKSTFLNLLMRFYDPTRGRILMDGCDISQMTQEDLRSRLALIPQKSQLFSGTIADNIRVGHPQATDEEVRRAADIAAATAFIEEKPDGFSSEVSQGGKNFSGGQRQRIAIARAAVRDAEVYIFDDSFSALDFKTDADVRRALHEQMRDSTVIMVAQRVSVAMDADKVVVFDEGRIVGVGTHAELLESCEVYREIAASQLSADELAQSVAGSRDAIASAGGGPASAGRTSLASERGGA